MFVFEGFVPVLPPAAIFTTHLLDSRHFYCCAVEEIGLKKYVVVEFTNDNSVEFVPKTWISEDKDHCYFPETIPSNFEKLRTNPASPLDPSWNLWHILIVKSYSKQIK